MTDASVPGVRDKADEIADLVEWLAYDEPYQSEIDARIRALLAKARLAERRKVAEEIVRPVSEAFKVFALCTAPMPGKLEAVKAVDRMRDWLSSLGEPSAPEGE